VQRQGTQPHRSRTTSERKVGTTEWHQDIGMSEQNCIGAKIAGAEQHRSKNRRHGRPQIANCTVPCTDHACIAACETCGACTHTCADNGTCTHDSACANTGTCAHDSTCTLALASCLQQHAPTLAPTLAACTQACTTACRDTCVDTCSTDAVDTCATHACTNNCVVWWFVMWESENNCMAIRAIPCSNPKWFPSQVVWSFPSKVVPILSPSIQPTVMQQVVVNSSPKLWFQILSL